MRSLGNSSSAWPLAIKASSHLGSRQVRVPTRRLQFRIGVGMGLHDRADVGRQLRVLLFAAPPTSRGEVLQTAHPLTRLVQSLLDRLASPAEASFGLSGTAVAQFRSHLGLEQAALVSGQSSGTRTKQGINAGGGRVHERDPPPETRQSSRNSLASRGMAGNLSSWVGFHPPIALTSQGRVPGP